MIQGLLKLILFSIGMVYIVLDSFVKYPNETILGIDIDEDFAKMSRKELCGYLDDKFNLGEKSFWGLPSTSKIRLGCQLGRNHLKG